MSFVMIFLAIDASSCYLLKPIQPMPVYDVLKPSLEVDILKVNDDGTVVVSGEFIVWVKMLEHEIKRLREKTGEIW